MADPRTDELTLRVAEPGDLPRLGRDMSNCLASYGRGRTDAGDRIVEVRRGGQTLYAVHVRAGRVVMFEAAGNRPPPREDVPLVHELLRRHGLLEATANEAARTSPRVRRPRPQPVPPRPRQPRLRPPPPPPGVSVQQLAAALLSPPSLGAPEWPELAAALWATGRLPRLPDPSEAAWEQVILDLAERLAVGDDARLPRGPEPTPEDRAMACRRLSAPPPPRTVVAHRRHRMAEILAGPVRP